MAQDFQDLTGQVIKKIVEMVQLMEHDLLDFLMDYQADSPPALASSQSGHGPVVSPDKHTDVVTDQQQVDDLLASLGF